MRKQDKIQAWLATMLLPFRTCGPVSFHRRGISARGVTAEGGAS
jgi:hypothetical protein